MIYPIIVENLIEIYTWRGMFLIIGGIVSNTFISGLISIPRKCTKTNHGTSNNQFEGNQKGSHQNVNEESTETEKESTKKELELLCKQLLNVLRKKSFAIFDLSVMATFPVLTSVFTIIIDYLVSKGIERETGVWLLFGVTVANGVIRPITGLLARLKIVSKLALPGVFMMVGAFGLLPFPFAETVVECSILACLCGISFGGIVSSWSITTLYLLGQKDYSIGLGLVFTSVGICSTLAGPMTGTYMHNCTTYYHCHSW